MAAKKGRARRGVGFIRARGKGVWLMVIGFEGQEHSKATHARTKREALDNLAQYVAAVKNGSVAAAKVAKVKADHASLFSEAAADFVANYMRQDADSEGTRRAYAGSLARVGAVLGDPRISSITTDMLHRGLRKLHGEGLAINTMRIMHAVVGQLLRNAIERGLITGPDPTPKFSKLQLGKGTPREPNALTADQVAELLSACSSDPELLLWVQVMLAIGARSGEALGLRWQDIDFVRGTLAINGAVKRTDTKGQGRLGATKSRHTRTVPLGATLGAALQARYLEMVALCRRLDVELQPSDCVFMASVEARGVPRSLDGMRSRFSKRVARCPGLKGVTPHWSRHTAITLMLAGTETAPGVSVADAAAIAGHSNPAITARVYAHAMASGQQRGIALSDTLLGPRPEPAANVFPLRAKGAS